jgi:hypothetical protein
VGAVVWAIFIVMDWLDACGAPTSKGMNAMTNARPYRTTGFLMFALLE